jgi:hypothetical protein
MAEGRGVIEGRQWDESLFAGAAGHYLRGRLPYAPGFADLIAEARACSGRPGTPGRAGHDRR